MPKRIAVQTKVFLAVCVVMSLYFGIISETRSPFLK